MARRNCKRYLCPHNCDFPYKGFRFSGKGALKSHLRHRHPKEHIMILQINLERDSANSHGDHTATLHCSSRSLTISLEGPDREIEISKKDLQAALLMTDHEDQSSWSES